MKVPNLIQETYDWVADTWTTISDPVVKLFKEKYDWVRGKLEPVVSDPLIRNIRNKIVLLQEDVTKLENTYQEVEENFKLEIEVWKKLRKAQRAISQHIERTEQMRANVQLAFSRADEKEKEILQTSKRAIGDAKKLSLFVEKKLAHRAVAVDTLFKRMMESALNR